MSAVMRFALMLVALSLSATAAWPQDKKTDKAQKAKKAETKKADAKKADAGGPPAACKQMADVCRKAGYLVADWKGGEGLWRDCVEPTLQGHTIVPGGTRPLPSMDPKVVAECKARHPKFGAKPAAKKK